MDELDFSKPVPRKPAPAPAAPAAPVYNVAVAMEFFRSAGKAESFAQGATIFSENDKGGGLFGKRDRMYLLLTGAVDMQVQGKVIGSVGPGEIFGEMAAIARAARTATAVAKDACTVIGLDDKQFLEALQGKPEFALTMMSVMNQRVRSTIARLQASRALHAGEAVETTVFDKKMLAGLARLMAGQEPVRGKAREVIMHEGTSGNLMYVVLEGRVTILIKGSPVGRVGPGGVFGEMALVDQSPRAASAIAESECTLLAINRETFLYLVKTSPAFGASLLAGIAARAKEMAGRGK